MRKKSICILAFVSFFAINSIAQKEDKKDNRSYIKAGLNMANVTISDDGRFDDANMLYSFHAGIVKDLKVAPMIYLQPGILFTGKGSKTSAGKSTDATYFSASSSPYYIEVPVNLIIKLPINKTKLFFGAGPYGAIGLAGKNKAEGKIIGFAFETDDKIDFSDDDPTTTDYEEGAGFGVMKRFDYGLNGTIGFEQSNMFLSANYGYGLAKLQSGSSSTENDDNKHRVISISLGFRL